MSKKSVQPSAKVLVSVSEVAKATGYSRNHVYNLIAKNKIKAETQNGKVLVSLDEVRNRAEENKSRIKKLKPSRRRAVRKVVSTTAPEVIKTTSNNSFEGSVFMLAGILGIVIGYLITTALK
jgi:excisionase family DNA binding protein